MQDWRVVGQVGCRTGGMKERKDSAEEGCWKRQIQDRRKQERRDAGQANAGHE